MRKLILFIFILLSFSSCKKKNGDALFPIIKHPETVAMDTEFGDGGSLLFQGKEYANMYVSDETINLHYSYSDDINTLNDYSEIQKLSLNGGFKSNFGVLGYSDYNFYGKHFSFLTDNKIEAYNGNNVHSINLDGSYSTNQYGFQGQIHCKLSNGKYLASELVGLNKARIFQLNADFSLDNSFEETEISPVFRIYENNNNYYVLSFSTKKLEQISQVGGLVASFGDGGYIKLPEGMNIQAYGITFSDNGFYIGYSSASSPISINVKKYDLNGKIELAFGSQGMALLSPEDGESSLFIGGIAISEGNNIYVHGTRVKNGPENFIVRINKEGFVDRSIGENGINFIGKNLYAKGICIYKNKIYALANVGPSTPQSILYCLKL